MNVFIRDAIRYLGKKLAFVVIDEIVAWIRAHLRERLRRLAPIETRALTSAEKFEL